MASAVFLHALAWATGFREGHPALLFGLPVAGAVVGWVYQRFGASVAGGSNLLLERVRDPGPPVPFRMTPLILLATVITHLFGGSAGREGTAMQQGGSLGSALAQVLRLSEGDRQLAIQCGISGGFGSVFGTPLAGTVFGLEVLRIGRMSYAGLVPCFVASVVGDLVCRALGARHYPYSIGVIPALTPSLWLWVLLAGALFGLTSIAFTELIHTLQQTLTRWIAPPWLRPTLGGIVVIFLTWIVGTHDYLGLGLPLIERSFTPGGVVLWAFALKLLFTVVTLGSGFKGGEVTPLFCIGAALGAALAKLTGQPTAFFAALGFVAVFGAAANTPLACIVMGIELFGAPLALPLATVCLVSYTLSGQRGIYSAQRKEISDEPDYSNTA